MKIAATWRLLLVVLAASCGRENEKSSELAAAFSELESHPILIESALAPNLAGNRLSYLRKGDFYRFETRSISERNAAATVIAEASDFFANWADVPAMVEAGDGSWLAHWLQIAGPDTYDYGIRIARSSDAGASWTELGWLHDDAWNGGAGEIIPGEHGFVSWVPEGAGARGFWLDGRATGGHDRHDGGAMQLRTTLIRGNEIAPSELVDDRICDCCSTAAVATANGPLVAFRDRTDGEIRDIHLLRGTEDGWQRTVIDTSGWEIAGCPVNGPGLAADGDRVLVAWFSGAPETSVWAAWSLDGGLTFDRPKLLTTNTLGRVAAAISGDLGYVAWLAQTGTDDGQPGEIKDGEIQMVTLDVNGGTSEPIRLVSAAASRRSGVPRLTAHEERLGLAWTHVLRPDEGPLATEVRFSWLVPPS